MYTDCVFSVMTGQVDSSDQDDKLAFLDLAGILSRIFFLGCYTSLLCHDLCDDCVMCSLTVTNGSFGQQVLALLIFLLQACTVL